MADVLKGKVVIVTGAGRGVGAEIAKLAALEGARVVVNDLGVSQGGDGGSLGPAEEIVQEIRAAGGEAIAEGSNVASWDGAHALFANAMKAFGDVDAIVNNAGILRDTIFHKMSQEEWNAVIQVNLTGCFNVARAAAPHFKDKQKGSFVHMTSTSGLIGNFGQANYAAAKMGVAALSKSIALDMQKFGIRSNAIAPFAYTRMVSSIPDTPENAERNRVNKMMTADKIAPFVVALCSDGAKDVSGQLFGVRRNEIYLFSQPRPIRSVHAGEGWSPQACIDRALPALRASFYKLDRSSDVFTWEPV
ncbi:NAD(P)-dependent dehydrogenase (short-subunit alcohol dehydrogenase family) [Panacagrimonas perspica]|uniref:NAD(P)-dependent dehydrogenase (Short-subunit alcohol dehydrogenase family) n=1 Tax=Panacagrimonas perspica TaxID=381431 RepID=A0A4S3K696_9GAMM|nr:SDR family NAD(P)-dependent oxidoreductase [Panacagrimonas perspica]TDU26915.1 NAD(P)-dependent dehydrogenase (short-subunit alcohol dehydrogenase family) [Panacagrimonas perspica]THD03682.1 3-hydroxyacyl-CoA dehydrogenase [Panacagrimonas perspica]